MEIRHAKPEDFKRIMEIYAYARRFMEEHGNPRQWGITHWPPEDLIKEDIRTGYSYVCTENDWILGVFYYDFGHDIESTYREMAEGAWINEEAYGVVHRIAGDGSVKGIGRFCIDWALKQSGHLRIDTHGDNYVMQNLLLSMEFEQRGIIYVEEDNDPRLAFEKIL